jgi:hypothetical protein
MNEEELRATYPNKPEAWYQAHFPEKYGASVKKNSMNVMDTGSSRPYKSDNGVTGINGGYDPVQYDTSTRAANQLSQTAQQIQSGFDSANTSMNPGHTEQQVQPQQQYMDFRDLLKRLNQNNQQIGLNLQNANQMNLYQPRMQGTLNQQYRRYGQ